MSASFSSAQVLGTLGRDPEARATPSGAKVVNFSVAVNRRQGKDTVTDWRNIVCWGQIAEFAEKYLKKGKSVFIAGELQDRSWDDKTTGTKRTVTEIKADRIEFADRGDSGTQTPSTRQSAPAPRQQASPAVRTQAAAPDPFDPDRDDDIPF